MTSDKRTISVISIANIPIISVVIRPRLVLATALVMASDVVESGAASFGRGRLRRLSTHLVDKGADRVRIVVSFKLDRSIALLLLGTFEPLSFTSPTQHLKPIFLRHVLHCLLTTTTTTIATVPERSVDGLRRIAIGEQWFVVEVVGVIVAETGTESGGLVEEPLVKEGFLGLGGFGDAECDPLGDVARAVAIVQTLQLAIATHATLAHRTFRVPTTLPAQSVAIASVLIGKIVVVVVVVIAASMAVGAAVGLGTTSGPAWRW